MTHAEILQKAITQAIGRGWKGYWDGEYKYHDNMSNHTYNADRLVFENGEGEDYDTVRYEAVIYNHDFARALWGDSHPQATRNGETITIGYHKGWDQHLQQMVIAPDPIKYLGENI